MSAITVTPEQIKSNSFGEETITLKIPRFTDVLIITTISRAKDNSTNIDTKTYGTEQIEELLKGDKK